MHFEDHLLVSSLRRNPPLSPYRLATHKFMIEWVASKIWPIGSIILDGWWTVAFAVHSIYEKNTFSYPNCLQCQDLLFTVLQIHPQLLSWTHDSVGFPDFLFFLLHHIVDYDPHLSTICRCYHGSSGVYCNIIGMIRLTDSRDFCWQSIGGASYEGFSGRWGCWCASPSEKYHVLLWLIMTASYRLTG